ncbi:MAG: DUF2073 domain-containing protein [Candidatus Pacearchaeota archaeon]|nr:DUF2073 domain-containing protein [Candidatus Pacearchaeota archaeon]
MRLALQFIPYAEIAYLTSYQRVKKLIEAVSANKILLIQGKLHPDEETDLIKEAMKKINKSGAKFKGIEIATFVPKAKNLNFFQSFKEKIAVALLGERDIFTVVGPATIVKEIKKDPTKLELLLRK